MDLSKLRISSLNVNGLKSSFEEVRTLCDSSDIVLLQELMLLPYDLTLLNQIHTDFFGFGISPVCIDEGPLLGRPFGGVGILWRKSISACSVIKVFENVNFALGIEISCNEGEDVSIVNVYLPTDRRDIASLVDYSDSLEMLGACLESIDSPKVLVMGDFNAAFNPNLKSRFFEELHEFCTTRDLSVADTSILPPDTFTFLSPAFSTTSWLDHVVGNKTATDNILNIKVAYDICLSDHMPLFLELEASPSLICEDRPTDRGICKLIPQWDVATSHDLKSYSNAVESRLTLLDELNADETDILSSLTDIMLDSAKETIPSCRMGFQHPVVPGWNDYLRGLHFEAREAYLLWRSDGKPRMGDKHKDMITTRATFRAAFRKCKRDSKRIQADKLATSLLNLGPPKFWREVKKIFSSSSGRPTSVGGANGEAAVAEMWRDHFSTLLNENGHPPEEQRNLNELKDFPQVRMKEIRTAIYDLNPNASSGEGGLTVWHLRFAPESAWDLLARQFTGFLRTGQIPAQLLTSELVPIVKNKLGDLSSPSNYRGISISPTLAKLLEQVILIRVRGHLKTSDAQFGFKPGLDTNMATSVVDLTMDYYARNGSAIFIAFLDAKKAFDRVRHAKLFAILRRRNIPEYIVRSIEFWYWRQMVFVKWGATRSSSFRVSNGVRQGGSLSPLLFNVYIDDLIVKVRDSGIGCHIEGIPCNIVAYADDIVLLAPSRSGLQLLIDICLTEAEAIDLVFNHDKSKCLIVNSRAVTLAPISLNNRNLEYVESFTHLGHVIMNTRSHVRDVSRFRKAFFRSFNSLLFRFSHCSLHVKALLYKAYCAHFYGCELWNSLPKGSRHELEVSVHSAMKKLCGKSRFDRNSITANELHLLTLDRCMALRQILFYQRMTNSRSDLIHALSASAAFQSSPLNTRIEEICNSFGLLRAPLRSLKPEDLHRFFEGHQNRYTETLMT